VWFISNFSKPTKSAWRKCSHSPHDPSGLFRFAGAKKNLRDYSGHLASQYLTDRDPDEPGEESETREL
jgi:hypothetical protein